jgi:hypothetical protein
VPSNSITSGSAASDSGQSGWVPTSHTSPTSRSHDESTIGTGPNRSGSHYASAVAPPVGGRSGSTGCCASSLAWNR